MADNTTLDPGASGDAIVTREISHAGDTAKLQGMFLMGITGTEGSYTAAAVNGDATNGIDVDVTRVIPGTDATHLGKAEDAAHASGDTGIAVLAVRRDSAAVGSGTDGDYSTLNVNSSGQLHVAGPVTNAGTFVVQVDGTALTRLTDIETNTDSIAVVGNGAAATAQRVTLANDSTGIIATVGAVTAITNALPAGTNAIGKLAANSGVDIGDVDITSIAAGDNNIGNVDIVTVPTDPFGANADAASATGSISAKLRFIASTGIPVTGTVTVASHAVTNAGTFAVQAAGDVAHDGADSGNPTKQGFKATTALSGLTLVANADRTDGFAGVDGVQIVRPHCNLEDIVSGVVAITDGSSTSGIAAQGANVKTYITTVIIANTSATAVTVDLRDGTAGSVKATFPVPANTSGLVCNLPVPLGFSANTIVAVDPSAAASTITATLIGFKSKV